MAPAECHISSGHPSKRALPHRGSRADHLAGSGAPRWRGRSESLIPIPVRPMWQVERNLKSRDIIVDYLGTHQHLAVDLHCWVDDAGAMCIQSGDQRLYEGPIAFRFPMVFSGIANVKEWWDEDAECFRIDVDVANKLLGPLFGYSRFFHRCRVPLHRCRHPTRRPASSRTAPRVTNGTDLPPPNRPSVGSLHVPLLHQRPSPAKPGRLDRSPSQTRITRWCRAHIHRVTPERHRS